MTIYGLQKTTLIDYPGNVACTVFTYGCNFRCPFCHNPELVTLPPQKDNIIPEEDFFNFLKKRKKMLDGVVITGGEPLLNEDILQFCSNIKSEGFLVKVDTNGSFPERLEALVKAQVVDYVAMDIKSSLEEYEHITGGFTDFEKILKSIKLLMDSNIDYEFRTTVVKGLHTKDNIEKIGVFLKGAKNFSLQNFKSGKTISKDLKKENEFKKEELNNFEEILKKYIENVIVKNIY